MAQTMKSIVMTGPGGPEVLRAAELPIPQIGTPHDVRVRVHAAALNPVDCKIRTRGQFAGTNPVLGCDGAGVVESVGSAVERFSVGDAVYFMNGGYGSEQGTYAQYVVIDERYLARKPASLDFAAAAAVPLVTITAWEALHDQASVHTGQSVLVHGGAGGVGHVAIQLAALAGARVAATVSSSEKANVARSLGASEAINYRTEDVKKAVLRWTDERGADTVFDTVGGATYDSSLELLKYHGTLVTICERRWPSADAAIGWERNLRVAFTFVPAPQVLRLEERLRQREILEHAARLIDEQKLRVNVGATFALEQAADAHRALEGGKVTGKVVLEIP